MIALEITDAFSGKKTIVNQTPSDAKKLYDALRQVFGDSQQHAQPGELITIPSVNIKL
jgi:hypothetical protein